MILRLKCCLSLNILKCRILALLLFDDTKGAGIQDDRDLSLRYYYVYLRTTDYRLHASRHDVVRYFICEYPGKTFFLTI